MLQDVYQQDLDFMVVQALIPFIQNKNFIDIGAEKGSFASILMSHGFQGTLFEPLPKHFEQLEKLINQTPSQFFPYAIDKIDRSSEFHIACDEKGDPLDYFHSLHRLENDLRVEHKKSIPVTCRSLDSLIQEGVLPKNIGILKTDTEGNDLHVMQGMGNLTAEVIICEFFMPGLYAGWEQGDPQALIEQAKKLGFKNYIAIKRIDEFEFVSASPAAFFEKQWGNLVFISDRIYEQCAKDLADIIKFSENRLLQLLRLKENNEAQRIQQLSEKIFNIFEQQMNHKIREAIYNNKLSKRVFGFIKRKLKTLIRPKLNLSETYQPKTIYIPNHYHQLQALTSAPVISIVTPAYNHAHYIERTMKSVLDQAYPRLEYIVQDGGSKDDTAVILERYSNQLKHWESKKDKGQSNAINLGFQHATGEIMAYLNSDDLLLPGSLNYVAHFFETHPDVDVVYGHRVLIDESDREIGRWVLPQHNDDVLQWADYIPQETLFWRRSIWEKAGGQIDESFQFAMDWDLILRFHKAGAKFVRLPRFLGAFRVHQSQKSIANMEDIGAKEMERLRQRCHGRNVSQPEIGRHVFGYILQHVLYQKLYDLGLLKY